MVLLSFVISLAVQLVGGAIAIWRKTDLVTDISYGLTFVIIAGAQLLRVPNPSLLQILMNVLVIIWGVRLAGYLFVRILKTKRDARFDGVRENPRKFLGFWALQAVTVPLVMLPVTVGSGVQDESPLSVVQALGLMISLLGLVIETVADTQKFRFKNDPANKDRWVDVGLWKYARHPNYFGEMLVWWGLLIAMPVTISLGGFVLAMIGPLFISFLLLFVSGVPPLEKRYREKFKGNKQYAEYVRSTSLLVPVKSVQI